MRKIRNLRSTLPQAVTMNRLPAIWPHETTAYIIGGGPSLAYAAGVEPGKDKYKTIAQYLEPIHDQRVIGVNNSYMLGPWIDVLWFGDCNWFLFHEEPLKKFPGLKASCCPRFKDNPRRGVFFLAKDREKMSGITRHPDRVSWNKNSGGSAINVAYHLGARRIVLLGFDMQDGPQSATHWHGGHREGIGAPGRRGQRQYRAPYPRFLAGFPQIKKDADRLGVEIINAIHPKIGSAIEDFSKVPIAEVIGR